MLEIADDVIEVQKSTQVDDENKWCVYCHTNKINGKKYFGITSNVVDRRWKNGNGYRGQCVFWRAINKYTWDGFEHEIIFDNLTRDEAIQKEVELIAKYKTNCCRYKDPAYGYNMTDGGEGTSGHNPYENKTPEEMEIISKKKSESLSGEKNGMYGKTGSENPMYGVRLYGESNPNYGNHKLAGENNPFYGKHHTRDSKEKLRQSHLGKIASEETRKKLSEKKERFQKCKGKRSLLYRIKRVILGATECY